MLGRNEMVTEYGGGLNGTRTGVVEQILKPGGGYIKAQVEYGYDNLYRLVHEHRTALNQGDDPGVAYEYNFAYDAAGNRTAWQVDGGTPTTYAYDAANKMTSPGTFTYDDKGNTTRIVAGTVTTDYAWDLQNRMIQWQKTNQTTETYLYNADGMRVRKTPDGGTQTDFLLDIDEIAEEMTGSNDVSYVGPGLIEKIDDTGRSVYHADGIGSTRAISDANEAVTQAEVYDAYGNRLTTSGPSPTFAFAGQYRYYADSTGLDYLKARYYDPGLGRFTSSDPIGYSGGLNVYSYVGNQPVAAVDPSGLTCYLPGCLLPTPVPPGDPEKDPCCVARAQADYVKCVDGCRKRGNICKGLGIVGCMIGCSGTGPAYPVCLAACLTAWSAACGVATAECAAECRNQYEEDMLFCPSRGN